MCGGDGLGADAKFLPGFARLQGKILQIFRKTYISGIKRNFEVQTTKLKLNL